MNRREEVATLAMALPITEGRGCQGAVGRAVGARRGDRGVVGVVPFRVVAGDPEPAPWSVEAGTPVPAR